MLLDSSRRTPHVLLIGALISLCLLPLSGCHAAAVGDVAAPQHPRHLQDASINDDDQDLEEQEHLVSYVMEPFEVMEEDWLIESSNSNSSSASSLNAANVSISSDDNALFGKSALWIQTVVSPEQETNTTNTNTNTNPNPNPTTSIEWILDRRFHNCHNAEYLSLWYKAPAVSFLYHMKVMLMNESENAGGDNNSTNSTLLLSSPLMSYTVHDTILDPTLPSEWKELRMYPSTSNPKLQWNRIKGWRIELQPHQGAGNGVDVQVPDDAIVDILIDQLACVGGGDMVGAAFYPGTSTFQQAIEEGSWEHGTYQSELSEKETTTTLSNQEGQLDIDYTLEQVEAWGGFAFYTHSAPGAAYYNLSLATHLTFGYQVPEDGISSSPGRTNLRFILLDVSDCTTDCDQLGNNGNERWYSFHSLFDEPTNGPSQVSIPLIGSTEPTAPFWLTGWSGILGNSKLDLDQIKGFGLELNLDASPNIGSVVTGSIQLSDFEATNINTGDDASRCVLEPDVYFLESAPQFTRFDFLGPQCCDTCAADPECLYAIATAFGHCFLASYLDPDYILLSNNKIQQSKHASIWMDDAAKRGDFCDRCYCLPQDRTIDCRGKDLAILPKTFDDQLDWTPQVLDLRDNPRLVLLGSGAFGSIGDTLEELWLPSNMRHIAPQSLEVLLLLKSIRFEDEEENHALMNTITEPDSFFSDVCCGRGAILSGLDSPLQSLTFCKMQISLPGADSIYEEFVHFIDAVSIEVLTPSSDFMAEAAESPEKCAEFCTINKECRFFAYDGRITNAEHMCYLYADSGTHTQTVCCDPDHYADENQTLPGWVSGKPPQTRHELDSAKILLSAQELSASQNNDYTSQYQIVLGSTPLRGAVWVEPNLVSTTSKGLNVTVSPSRLVLYDDSQEATVTMTVHGVTSAMEPTTLVIQNVITSCDEAFMLAADSLNENMVYVAVSIPKSESETNLALVIALPLAAVVLIGFVIFFFYEHKRKQNDSVWKVKREELKLMDPPEIIGRGTFGLVILGEYRGTQVAIKRVIPPKKKKKSRIISGASKSHDSSDNNSTGDRSHNSKPEGSHDGTTSRSGDSIGIDMAGDTTAKANDASHKLGKSSWGNLSMGSMGGRGVAPILSLILKSGSGKTRKTSKHDTAANWRQLRNEFMEEMRYLSKLRHPCITTVMGAVIGNNIEPMLVLEYMGHGSLYDILHNKTMVIEGELLLPILRDISQGVRFLHSADPQCLHGDLKAKNILVDSKFRAKVADFGLSQKKNIGGTGTPFWMAPELLRGESTNTAETDVYSFGIILYEVYSRRDPYEGEDPIEVLRLVLDKNVRKRPPVPDSCPQHIQSLMAECLRNDPTKRPTFEELDIRLKREDVETLDPKQASAKSTQISLFDIFPHHIAEALRDGRTVEAEHKDVVTIFFSDIIGFTSISSTLEPRKVANLLDRLYTKLDGLSRKYDIFKVETIGDAYMAVTNLTKDQPTDHAKRIAEFAIEAVTLANETLVDVNDPSMGYLNIRAGFHCGSVVADVVGTRNPRYCLFGDAVNTASRMESNSKINRIHCSSAAAEILMEQSPELPLKSRGTIPIKGKGEMHTYWVNEEGDGIDHTKPFTPDERSMLEWAKNKSVSTRNLKGLRRKSSKVILEETIADFEIPLNHISEFLPEQSPRDVEAP